MLENCKLFDIKDLAILYHHLSLKLSLLCVITTFVQLFNLKFPYSLDRHHSLVGTDLTMIQSSPLGVVEILKMAKDEEKVAVEIVECHCHSTG